MKKREQMKERFKIVGKSFTVLSLLALFVFSVGFPTIAKEEWGFPLEGDYEVLGEFSEKHDGIDLLVKEGSHALAVTEGEVINLVEALDAEDTRCFAPFPFPHLAIIDPNGYIVIYYNISSIFVKEGEKVKAGQSLGIIGGVEGLKGSYLHFSVLQDTKEGHTPVNPRELVKF